MLQAPMRYWDAVFAFFVAMAVAALLTPLAGQLARRVGAIGLPERRGLASAPRRCSAGWRSSRACWWPRAIWMPAKIKLPRTPHTPNGSAAGCTCAIMPGACLITLVGAIDDAIDLQPLLKLLGQIAAAVIAVEGGVIVTDGTMPFVGSLQFPNTGGVLTVIWLVGIMNAVNFIDGVDGLAAGLCTIDGVAFTIIAFDSDVNGAGILAAITAGAALGFLFHNFHPASIFMGDSGANLLGYLLGVVAVIGSLKTARSSRWSRRCVILAVPFLDTGFVVAKRLKYRRKPWSADANHFHHRMARIGFSRRKTVLYMYVWTVLLAGFAVAVRVIPYPSTTTSTSSVGSLVMAAIALVAVAAQHLPRLRARDLQVQAAAGAELRRDDPDTTEHEIDEHGRAARSRPASSSVWARARWRRRTSKSSSRSSRSTGRRSASWRARRGPRPAIRASPRRRAGGRRDGRALPPQAEELYYFVAGAGRMRLGEEEAEVRAGDCVVIPPGTAAQALQPWPERWSSCAVARRRTRTMTP